MYADDLQIYWPQEISKETLYPNTGQRDTSTKNQAAERGGLGMSSGKSGTPLQKLGYQ